MSPRTCFSGSETLIRDRDHRSRPLAPGSGALPVVFLLAAVCASAAVPATGAVVQEEETGPRERVAESFFGYEPSEERLYRLGPEDALAPGESAEWRIGFEGFVEIDDERYAEFSFEHVRFELIPGTWNPAEELLEVRVQGRVIMNRDAFPLRVEFEQDFVIRGERASGDSRRRLRYVYDEEASEYRKQVGIRNRDWDFDFAPVKYEQMDLEALRGLFLYMPSALGCLGTSRGTCVEQELSFANPGFLSMVLPYLLEASESEREFMFFTPSSVGLSPFRPVTGGRWLSRERDTFESRDRYFQRWKLRLGVSEEIEVGPRTMHAWKLDMGGGIDEIWIEPSGRVLRVDLGTTPRNRDDRHIRLVFSFEDFVTPNEDPAEECC